MQAKPRIAVIGAGDNACNAVELVKERFGFCAVVADVALDAQWRGRTEGAVQAAGRLGCPVVSVTHPDAAIERLQEMGVDLVLMCGTKWILSDRFITALKRRVINLHPSRLPSHGGGGVFSWQILNGIEYLSISVHWVTIEIDSGPLIFTEEYSDTKLRTPIEFIEKYYEQHPHAVTVLLDILTGDPDLAPPPSQAGHHTTRARTYFPLLNSEVNGALDWTWSLDELERFLRAFGKPYKGAFSYFGDTKFHIANWRAVADRSMHPFCHGLVLTKGSDDSVRVACREGYIEIIDICVEGEPGVERKASTLVKVGGRVWVPHAVADQSRTFRQHP